MPKNQLLVTKIQAISTEENVRGGHKSMDLLS